MKNKYPPYNSRMSFELTSTDQGNVLSCGLVFAPGVVGYWPTAIHAEHGPRPIGTQYSAVQLLVHHDLDLLDVMDALDELRALVARRLDDLKPKAYLTSELHDPLWRDDLAAREHFAQTGEEPTPRQINLDE